MGIAGAAAERSLAAIARAQRDEVFISLVQPDEVRRAAERVDDILASGSDQPLAGLTFAVKDNIDVAGLPTTAGCPAFAYRPASDAPAVLALVSAGAVCLGKTNLDQFATGLVGTRSPYGAVRNAVVPERIAGGSSSGSAVAVALGLVDLALGTDTAGSGRVPAALNGVVGLKATRGTVSTTGVVPASRSFDCVSVFAGDVALAERAMAELTGPRGWAPGRREFPPTTPLGPRGRPVVARARSADLGSLAPGWLNAYFVALDRLEAAGCAVVEIDLAPFLAAGRLLYGGAFVAERYAAVGAFIDAHPGQVDPTVAGIIGAGRVVSAAELVADWERLSVLAQAGSEEWARVGADSMLLPTTTRHPTLADVATDPVGVNVDLGRFTTFLNLLDMCAVAVPIEDEVDGLAFGVSCIGPAFSDLVQLDLARRLQDHRIGTSTDAGSWRETRRGRLCPPGITLAVVGAHLSGQLLNHQLTERGARLLGPAHTAACYQLHALTTEPPKPGLRRVESGGSRVELEIWEIPPAGYAEFVAAVPPPMVIGTVELDDGTAVSGFLCEPDALIGAPDITAFGGWRAYVAARGAVVDDHPA